MSTIINAGRIAPIPKGLYNASTQYAKLDIVTFSNESYICKQACKGIAPTNGDYWQLLAGDAGGGKSIVSVTLTSSVGLVDTYTITYTDATTSTFTVTNGKDGEDGTDGTDGRGITSIVETTSTQESGGRNVVTVTYTDGTTSTFDVYNGEAGQDAEEDLMITATRIGGTDNYYSMSYTWQELKARFNDDLSGGNMFVQLQLPNNDWIKLPFIVFDTDDMLHFGAEYRDPISGIVANYDLFYGDDGFAILDVTPLVQPVVEVAGATPTQTLAPNTMYKFIGLPTSLTLTLGTPIDGIANIYAFSFVAGAANPTISLPASVTIDGTPSIAAGDYVEFSIMNNVALFKVVTI